MRNDKRFIIPGLWLSLTVFCVGNQSLWAQTAIPTQVTPGVAIPSLDKIQGETINREIQKEVLPAEKPEEVQLDLPEEPAIVQINKAKILVKEIRAEGVTALSPQELNALLAPWKSRWKS